MKTGPDALGTVKNELGSAKHENGTRRFPHRQKRVRERKTRKRERTPSVPSKISLGAQNMKMGPDALGIAENESGSVKLEIGTRRPPYRRKRVRERQTCKRDPTPSEPLKMISGAQNMKMGPDTLCTAENVSVIAKHENRTRRRRYSRK
jgi:hypothetical protein